MLMQSLPVWYRKKVAAFWSYYLCQCQGPVTASCSAREGDSGARALTSTQSPLPSYLSQVLKADTERALKLRRSLMISRQVYSDSDDVEGQAGK